MTTDYRDWKALCADLVKAVDNYDFDTESMVQDYSVLDRARAALAQPEPEGPTDEELDSVFHEHCWTGDDLMDHDDFVKAARAVLARWGRPAITPIPVSELLEPEWVRQEDQTHKTTDHAQLIDGEWWAPCSEMFSMQRIVDNARAHSARWGRPAITPIPVSERLPGPEDCAPWPGEPDCDPWCWAAKDIDGGWEWTQLGIGHFSSDLGRVWRKRGYTHWLPAHALPLPATPENVDG